MTKIKILFIAMIILSCNIKRTTLKNNDLKDLNLNGSVKTLTVHHFNLSDKFGKIEKTEIKYYEPDSMSSISRILFLVLSYNGSPFLYIPAVIAQND